MRLQYVKTRNHRMFADMVEAVETRAAIEARILLLAGDPGTGKSRCVDHFGAQRNAIHIEGMPGMSVAYLRELLTYELGCIGGTKFQQQKAINDAFALRRPTVILDEAQHGLAQKADCIEYLRRCSEQVGSLLVLVCHTSERYRFGEQKLAHIATRISALVEFTPANFADCALYLHDLCEVAVDEGVVKQALEQSRGRYRLLSNACRILEDLAKAKCKATLTVDDVKGVMLCEDAMSSLRKGVRTA